MRRLTRVMSLTAFLTFCGIWAIFGEEVFFYNFKGGTPTAKLDGDCRVFKENDGLKVVWSNPKPKHANAVISQNQYFEGFTALTFDYKVERVEKARLRVCLTDRTSAIYAASVDLKNASAWRKASLPLQL